MSFTPPMNQPMIGPSSVPQQQAAPFNPFGQSVFGGGFGGGGGIVSSLFPGLMAGSQFNPYQGGLMSGAPEQQASPAQLELLQQQNPGFNVVPNWNSQNPWGTMPNGQPYQPGVNVNQGLFGNQPIPTANGYTNPLPQQPARNLPGAMTGGQQGPGAGGFGGFLSQLLGMLGGSPNQNFYAPGQNNMPQVPQGGSLAGMLGQIQAGTKPGATTQPVARQTPTDNGAGAAAGAAGGAAGGGVRGLPAGLLNLINSRLNGGGFPGNNLRLPELM